MDLREETGKTNVLNSQHGVKPVTLVQKRRSHLLGVLKLPPETLIHSFGGLLRTAHHSLDVDLKAAVQELVDLPVVVVVVSG